MMKKPNEGVLMLNLLQENVPNYQTKKSREHDVY